MSVDQKTYELIDAYLKDELKVEEADKVKFRIRTEPEFAEQVELQQAIIAEIEIAREKELRSMLTEKGKVNYISNSWSTAWVRASAAIIIGFVALFFIIKYYMPEEAHPLVERSEDNVTEEVTQPVIEQPEAETPAMPKDSVLEYAVGNATPDTPAQEVPEVVEEEEVSTEIADASDPDERKDTEIATLREESDMLEVEEDVEVKKDQLLAERIVQIRTVGEIDKLVATSTDTEISSTSKKLSRKEKRKLEQADESDDTAGATAKALASTSNLSIELWESIVSFKGYVWDRETLLLYGIKANEDLQFSKFNGVLYMKRGTKYYIIRKSSKFEPYTELKDPSIISAISK